MMIPLESYICSNFVRYEKLGPIVADAFKGSTDTHLNIYIDLNSALKFLYTENNVDISNYKSLTACIINMCGHYREYFNKYLGVTTTIYIIIGDNCCYINRKLMYSYNDSFYNKMKNTQYVTNIIKNNLEILNNIIPYLPNIYIIEAEYEPAAIIAAIIEKNNSDSPNLIISKDIMNLQILPFYNKTALLRPKKYRGNDNSFIIGPLNNMTSIYNFWKYYYDVDKSKYNDKIFIHPYNLSLLMSLSKATGREKDRLISIKKAKQYIYNCVQDLPIKCSLKTLYEMNNGLDIEIPRTVLESRYKAIDINFAKSMYEDSVQYKLLNFIDLENPATVKRINDQLFYNNPIDLEKL